MKNLRKHIIALWLAVIYICIPITSLAAEFASSDYSIYVVGDGTFKEQNMINVQLPELTDTEYELKAVEIGVFECIHPSMTYSMYLDKDAKESKKILIYDIQNLNFEINLGDVTDYRKNAFYKLAYRYYVSPLSDESQFSIVDSDNGKDGWKLIGENNALQVTSSGFHFFVDKDLPTPTPNPDATPTPIPSPSPTPENPNPVGPVQLKLANFEPTTASKSEMKDPIKNYGTDKKTLYITNKQNTQWNVAFENVLNTLTGTITFENEKTRAKKVFDIDERNISTPYFSFNTLTNYDSLTDGMYKIYIEAKTTDGTMTRTVDSQLVGYIAIKRSNPPTPSITQDNDNVITIDYPSDASDSLFPDILTSKNSKTYSYKPNDSSLEQSKQKYDGPFTVDKSGRLNAYYEDFAGNKSQSSSNVTGLNGGSSSDDDPTNGGGSVYPDHSRQATTYYINTRRKGSVSLKGSIFDFLSD